MLYWTQAHYPRKMCVWVIAFCKPGRYILQGSKRWLIKLGLVYGFKVGTGCNNNHSNLYTHDTKEN